MLFNCVLGQEPEITNNMGCLYFMRHKKAEALVAYVSGRSCLQNMRLQEQFERALQMCQLPENQDQHYTKLITGSSFL